MDLNSFMSGSEAGIVLGVLLEGSVYIPPIHKRWPILERIGFAVLVLSLTADWHFQSAINEQHTRSLLAADNHIVELQKKLVAVAPRQWVIDEPEVANRIVAKLKPFVGQRVAVYQSQVEDPQEIKTFAWGLDFLMSRAGWLDPEGAAIVSQDKPQSSFRNLANNTTPVREGLPFVLIEFDMKASKRTRDAAEALAIALSAEDLRALYTPGGSPIKPPRAADDVLAITVGRRPFF